MLTPSHNSTTKPLCDCYTIGMTTSKTVLKYLAAIGRTGGEIGGKATGKKKRRGDSSYYKDLSAKAVRAKRKLARARKTVSQSSRTNPAIP